MYIYISNSPQTVCCSSFVFFSNGICLHRSFFKGLTSSLLLLSYFSHLQCFSSPFFFLAPAAKTKKRFLIIVSYCLFFFFSDSFLFSIIWIKEQRGMRFVWLQARGCWRIFFFFFTFVVVSKVIVLGASHLCGRTAGLRLAFSP